MGAVVSCPRCGRTLSDDDRFCPSCGAAMPATPTVPGGTADAPVPATAASDVEEKLRAALAPHLLLLRDIGAGGMGSVFLAREPALKRLVAVKVLSPELATSSEARARFEREAQAVAGLSHPNIVAVHGVGELADGIPYFVMQHVAGRSMAARLQEEGTLTVAEGRRVLGEVAAALAAAHAKGIIHRDIKPANILYEEETGRTLVSDFGIAAVMPKAEGGEMPRLTMTGMVVGTPQYMSPEQLLSEPVSEKTDIYALGLVGYELLTGRGPFEATSPHELIAAHLRDTPRRLSEVRDDVDPELDSLVARCLERDAAKRPSADEVARRLAPGGGVLLEWPPPGIEGLHGRLARLSRLYWIGSLLVLAAALPLLLAGTRLSSALVSPGTMALLLAAAAGAVMLLVAGRGTLKLGEAVSRAVRGGYAWLTVLETLADRHGDAGSLVTGSRFFATLPPARRSTLRRGRVARELALLAGGLAATPLLIALVVLGSGGLVGQRATWLAVLLPLGCLLVALHLAARERLMVIPLRKARTKPGPKTDPSRLAGPWYQTFEAVRSGQALGRGPQGRPSVGWGTALAVAALTALAVVLLVPLMIVGTLGPSVWANMVPKFANTQQKAVVADIARSYEVPKDTGITPLEAGRAFYALQAERLAESGFPQHPVPPLPPPPWRDSLAPGLFPTAQPSAYPGPDNLNILPAAMRGFSPAELAYLERLAHAPNWRAFTTVARAPAMDVIGARFVLPFPDDATARGLPIPRFAQTKEYAYAGVGRAAYFLARGQRDSAETALREIISFGFTLLDGTTLIEALIGAVIVSIGRSALEQFYTLTGNREGARLRARYDSVVAALDEAAPASGRGTDDQTPELTSPPAVRRLLVATAADRSQIRGVRTEVFDRLGFSPCTNVQELVFGPAADVRAAFARARTELARYPSELAVLDMMYETPQRLAHASFSDFGMQAALPAKALARAADVAGLLLRNRRLPGCARALLVVL